MSMLLLPPGDVDGPPQGDSRWQAAAVARGRAIATELGMVDDGRLGVDVKGYGSDDTVGASCWRLKAAA